MIRIPNFVEQYLTSDIKRGRVKKPHWFKCPIHSSPELEMLLVANPKGVIYGHAVLGLWERIQKWCVLHWKRAGQFILADGSAMSVDQIAISLNMGSETEFLGDAISDLIRIGWLEELDGAPVVKVPELAEYDRDDPDMQLVEHKIREQDTGEYSSTLRWENRSEARAAVNRLRDNKDCPLAYEQSRLLETALCDAAIDGRDITAITKAMSVYYQTEQGTSKYRTRPVNFVRNERERDDWDSWFNETDAQKLRSKLIRRVCDIVGDDSKYVEMMTKYREKPVTELIMKVEELEEKVRGDKDSGIPEVLI